MVFECSADIFDGLSFCRSGMDDFGRKAEAAHFQEHLLFATTLVALLFVTEIVAVTVTGMSRTIEITVFLYPLLFLLFQICLAYPLERKTDLASACRDTANFTYFWHPLVSLALRRVVNANFFLFTITTAICLLLGFGYHSLKNRRRLTYERRSKN